MERHKKGRPTASFFISRQILLGDRPYRKNIDFALFPARVFLHRRIGLFYQLHHSTIGIDFTLTYFKKMYSYAIAVGFGSCFVLRKHQALVAFLPHPSVQKRIPIPVIAIG